MPEEKPAVKCPRCGTDCEITGKDEREFPVAHCEMCNWDFVVKPD